MHLLCANNKTASILSTPLAPAIVRCLIFSGGLFKKIYLSFPLASLCVCQEKEEKTKGERMGLVSCCIKVKWKGNCISLPSRLLVQHSHAGCEINHTSGHALWSLSEMRRQLHNIPSAPPLGNQVLARTQGPKIKFRPNHKDAGAH